MGRDGIRGDFLSDGGGKNPARAAFPHLRVSFRFKRSG